MAQDDYADGRSLSNIEMRSLFDKFKTVASGPDTKQLLNLVRWE
jgi:hypothetical protein